jgi:hypothetical protein
MREHDEPRPISATEHRLRVRRVDQIARLLGFVGVAEYRHVYSHSCGAQYYVGPAPPQDLQVVYAEAFERDADPADFTLETIIAHECGHQELIRDPHLRGVLAKFPGKQFEEILASLVGSLLLADMEAAQTLVWKASAELASLGMSSASTVRFIERLRRLLRRFV